MPVSSSDSDTSESSDAEPDEKDNDDAPQDLDDEDPVPTASTGNYFQTKHELVETDIVIPEIDKVGADEALELVGEVMNIVEKLVIIKGLPSEILNRGSERALDSDTLLVFDDREVLGYVRICLIIFCMHSRSTQYQVDLRNLWPDFATIVSS